MSNFFSKKDSNNFSDGTREIPEIVSKIQFMYRESVSSKTKLVDTWKKSYDAYIGDLFKKNISNDRSNAVPNNIFATVETVKPIMVTNIPKNIVLPKNEDSFDKAMMLQETLNYEWRRTDFLDCILEFLSNGLIYGTAILGLLWNGESSRGTGEVEPVVISPFNFFIDPMATSIKNSEYCMYATYKSYGELLKRYPEKQEELEISKTNDLDDDLTYGKEKDNAKNQLLYIECYFRDYTIIEGENDNGETIKKMKYPNGRRVLIAGDVLLSDSENPYKDGEFPFREWKCYNLPNKFWGMGEVEQLVSVQKEICNLYDDIIENAHLMGNPIWIMDKNCGVAQGSLTNRKGLVVRKNPGTEVKRDAPPSMPSYVKDIANDLKYDVQVISGVYDATRGERPTSVTSGVAIQALQESSQGRIRLKTQNLERVLADVGSMWIKRIQQFWITPRKIRVMGGEYTPNSEPILVQGQPVQFKEIDNDMVDGDYDVEILTGSSMAVNRSARLDQLLNMAQMPAEDGKPIIDRRTILENSEIDNADEIIKRFEQVAQQEQQAALTQQQQQIALQKEQADMAHEQEIDRMAMNNQAQSQAKQQDIQGKLALQSQNKDVQSDVGELDENMTVQELVAYLSTLSDEEVQAYIKKNPKVLVVLQNLNKLSRENSKGGKNSEIKKK